MPLRTSRPPDTKWAEFLGFALLNSVMGPDSECQWNVFIINL